MNGASAIRNFLKSLGIGAKAEARIGLHNPYKDALSNSFYNLLFCDDLEFLRASAYRAVAGPWAVVLANSADVNALSALAADASVEGRMRMLAYNRLRAEGVAVQPKQILGVIVEVPQPQGLDTLAGYVDGEVRYLNPSGNALMLQEQESVAAMARELLALSQPVVDRLGPWQEQRLAPPEAGTARMTFLVSDGLYLEQGPLETLRKDRVAGPVLAKAAQLRQAAISAAGGDAAKV